MKEAYRALIYAALIIAGIALIAAAVTTPSASPLERLLTATLGQMLWGLCAEIIWVFEIYLNNEDSGEREPLAAEPA